MIGKKVLIGLPNREKKPGTVVGFTSGGNVEICCTTYERQENVKTLYGKSAFDGYVTVLDD